MKTSKNDDFASSENEKFWENPEVIEAWNDFVQHRKENRHPLKEQGIKRNKKELEKLSGLDPDKACEIINRVIKSGWRGIY